jgi:hypothetical protein
LKYPDPTAPRTALVAVATSPATEGTPTSARSVNHDGGVTVGAADGSPSLFRALTNATRNAPSTVVVTCGDSIVVHVITFAADASNGDDALTPDNANTTAELATDFDFTNVTDDGSDPPTNR